MAKKKPEDSERIRLKQYDALAGALQRGAAAQEHYSRQEVERAASETDTSPTPAQKEAGNYRKGRFYLHGLEIAIENPRDSIRSGMDPKGKAWEVRMPHHYGYIKRAESEADGDHVDCFIGPHPDSHVVFVVDQQTAGGRFDEHKAMLGFKSLRKAREAYLAAFTKGWKGLRDITPMTVGQFKNWLEHGDTGKPIASQVTKKYSAGGKPERYALFGGLFGGGKKKPRPATPSAPNPPAAQQPQESPRWQQNGPHWEEAAGQYERLYARQIPRAPLHHQQQMEDWFDADQALRQGHTQHPIMRENVHLTTEQPAAWHREQMKTAKGPWKAFHQRMAEIKEADEAEQSKAGPQQPAAAPAAAPQPPAAPPPRAAAPKQPVATPAPAPVPAAQRRPAAAPATPPPPAPPPIGGPPKGLNTGQVPATQPGQSPAEVRQAQENSGNNAGKPQPTTPHADIQAEQQRKGKEPTNPNQPGTAGTATPPAAVPIVPPAAQPAAPPPPQPAQPAAPGKPPGGAVPATTPSAAPAPKPAAPQPKPPAAQPQPATQPAAAAAAAAQPKGGGGQPAGQAARLEKIDQTIREKHPDVKPGTPQHRILRALVGRGHTDERVHGAALDIYGMLQGHEHERTIAGLLGPTLDWPPDAHRAQAQKIRKDPNASPQSLSEAVAHDAIADAKEKWSDDMMAKRQAGEGPAIAAKEGEVTAAEKEILGKTRAATRKQRAAPPEEQPQSPPPQPPPPPPQPPPQPPPPQPQPPPQPPPPDVDLNNRLGVPPNAFTYAPADPNDPQGEQIIIAADGKTQYRAPDAESAAELTARMRQHFIQQPHPQAFTVDEEKDAAGNVQWVARGRNGQEMYRGDNKDLANTWASTLRQAWEKKVSSPPAASGSAMGSTSPGANPAAKPPPTPPPLTPAQKRQVQHAAYGRTVAKLQQLPFLTGARFSHDHTGIWIHHPAGHAVHLRFGSDKEMDAAGAKGGMQPGQLSSYFDKQGSIVLRRGAPASDLGHQYVRFLADAGVLRPSDVASFGGPEATALAYQHWLRNGRPKSHGGIVSKIYDFWRALNGDQRAVNRRTLRRIHAGQQGGGLLNRVTNVMHRLGEKIEGSTYPRPPDPESIYFSKRQEEEPETRDEDEEDWDEDEVERDEGGKFTELPPALKRKKRQKKKYEAGQPSDRIPKAKAKEMLRHPPHGKPLTGKQERMLQAAAHKSYSSLAHLMPEAML